MKKTLFVLIGIAALVFVVFYTDRHLAPVTTSMAATNVAATNSTAAANLASAEPDVVFKDLQGNDVKLADLKGKVVWVDFWATWCEPCKIEIPWLIELQRIARLHRARRGDGRRGQESGGSISAEAAL